MKIVKLFLFSVLAVMISCKQQAPDPSGIEKKAFGRLADGTETTLYTLTNINGVSVSVTNYGGRITSIMVPDKKGVMGDIVLGYDSVAGYVADNSFQGSLVGRYANRIAVLSGLTERYGR
jgi:aldose 1-epimerase